MKLSPDKFTTAASVRKLLTCLETVGAFLVREDHAYDEMEEALDESHMGSLVDQQLGTKKETTGASWRTPCKTTDRDCEPPEQRGGTPAREYYEVVDDDERWAGNGDFGVEAQEDERHKVAMNIMRNWMIPETMTIPDQDKNAMTSSTGNKVDYRSVVWALKNQWDGAAIQQHDRTPHGSVNYTDVNEVCAYEYEPEQTEDAHPVMGEKTDEFQELE